MILIGVSPCLMYPDKERQYFAPKELVYLENDMACFLAQNNCAPILIPDLPNQHFYDVLEQCAGFVLQGGSDIAPHTYRAKPINAERWPGDPIRDALEFKIVEFAVKKRRPLLGICRGCQLINVFFGGTLYQDLTTELTNAIEHRNADQYDLLFHEVEIMPGGYLSEIYPAKSINVNSVHHQGIKELAPGFRIESIARKDKLIEAISSVNDHFILGVQWHPEYSHTLKNEVANPQCLIDLFIAKVKQHENN